jgi:hypothetical protein
VAPRVAKQTAATATLRRNRVDGTSPFHWKRSANRRDNASKTGQSGRQALVDGEREDIPLSKSGSSVGGLMLEINCEANLDCKATAGNSQLPDYRSTKTSKSTGGSGKEKG